MTAQPTDAELEEISRLLKERSFADALKVGEQLKVHYPDSHRVFGRLAFVYEAMKSYDYAIREISEAIRLAPDEPGYYLSRGRWSLDAGEPGSAVSNCTTAIEIEKTIGWTYYMDTSHFIRALAKHQLGDYLGALDDCQQVADDTVFWALGALQSKKALVDELTKRLGQRGP